MKLDSASVIDAATSAAAPDLPDAADTPAADTVLRETLRPLLAIVRQQSAAWGARLESEDGPRAALPPLALRSLAALRDYARSSSAEPFADAAARLFALLEQQSAQADLDPLTRSIIEADIEQLAQLLEAPLTAAAGAVAAGAPAASVVHEEIDPLLLPVFLEEAQELITGIGETLLGLPAAEQRGVADASLLAELARPLHTLKGSARMVGARHLSRCLHDMETTLQRLALDDAVQESGSLAALLALYDQAIEQFNTLEQGLAVASSPARRDGLADSQLIAPLIRIRTTLLDKLLNQVGEVSIRRAQLDNEITALQGDARALGEQLGKLAEQLRQLQRHCSDTPWVAPPGQDPGSAAPLALAGSMQEALGEALQRQKQLLQRVLKTREDLRQQGRTTRELQQELMHARMVKFNSMESRMQHLARQVALETGKPLTLELSDYRLHIDRAILERLMGPLEHLLRNAAVHGIEDAEVRRAAGKPVSGQLRIQASHEGNEAVIRVSDDGRGLDLQAIRDKARQRGLIEVQQISEARLAELIFEPGFSTSTQVSALAGRGVGMDVVRAEVAALGGRMTVHSRAGRGVLFTLYLPLSLAVQHVCLLRHGQQPYAIPSTLIERVVQLRSDQAQDALQQRALEFNGQRLALYPLHCLLDEPAHPAWPDPSDSAFALLIKRGDELMVIMADHVSGNREVVVKPVGPQVATLAGVVGATVLGDGQIVLIINPLLLSGARRADGRAAEPGVQ
ncbi:ATP-binding protein [uncultured Herbaspirillum sp.]|jgi:chemosensory pili system protein ChpA (sensor histidine kinase/response regulator)|uniref:chemotaxis protein CheA n=1 Tax=uncultured Herbaspirillum sp. TaxID=160236 RepID=UPI0025846868|nr:ATP-binding protein [uncultured Herbaspirillum sp.]